MGRFNRQTEKRTAIAAAPTWLLHSVSKFAHNGRAYEVCVDSSHRAWAVVYIFRQGDRIPVPVFGGVGLRHMPENGMEQKLLKAIKEFTRKGMKA